MPNKHLIISETKILKNPKISKKLFLEMNSLIGLAVKFLSDIAQGFSDKSVDFLIKEFCKLFRRFLTGILTVESVKIGFLSCENKIDEIYFPNETIIYPNNERDHL